VVLDAQVEPLALAWPLGRFARHDDQRRRLLSAQITSGRLCRLERGNQPISEIA
jgi:hypothetical protein